MTVEELIVYGKSHITSSHARILLAELLNLNPLELLNHLSDKVDLDTANKYKEEISAIIDGKPLQYVLGNVNFFGTKFMINDRVLIPRFETEELVENTINYIKKYFSKPLSIIDLGCGSGIIGLTLKKKFPTSTVDLIDISSEALAVASKNATKEKLDVNIYASNMLTNTAKKYDVIISNPPYIKDDETIDSIVRENEPALALYGGKDGLDLYRQILKDLKKHINDKCLISFEIGETMGQSLKTLCQEVLPTATVEIKKDLSGRDRMLFILYNLV